MTREPAPEPAPPRLPVVAVVGRPNVGKSTLVNRFVGRREAIVEERPGVTRDRVLHHASWGGRAFVVVDTGGLEAEPSGPLAGKVSEAALAAAREADLVLFVVDATQPPTADDREAAARLRRLGRPVLLVANKADSPARERSLPDLYELGLGDPIPVSALHGRRAGDLLDEVTRRLPPAPPAEEAGEPAVAIVGRPNVGKSSLFNRLAGGERSIVHPEPGTTRDAVDTVVVAGGERYRFVDTAGMRRASRVEDATEYYSVVRALRAIDRSQAALVVLDASEPLGRQDLRIADRVLSLGRSALLVLNKVDLLDAEARRAVRAEVRRRLAALGFAPLVEVSALTGEGVEGILPTLRRVLEARTLRIPTPLLNAALIDLQARTPIPSGPRRARVRYAVQVEVAPPTILLFGARDIPQRWLRYLERGLRERFGFEGTPIRFLTRAREPKR